MKIKHVSLTNKTLTVSEETSETGKLTLNKLGFAEEELTDRQCYNLGAHPDFILYDDKGEPIEPTEKVEKQLAVINDDQNKDVLEMLKQADEKIVVLETENENFSATMKELEEQNTNLTIDNENLKAEVAELKAQLEVKTGSEETKPNTDAEVLVEGQKKLEEGKAFIVKPNGSGVLQWYRDKENDVK